MNTSSHGKVILPAIGPITVVLAKCHADLVSTFYHDAKHLYRQECEKLYEARDNSVPPIDPDQFEREHIELDESFGLSTQMAIVAFYHGVAEISITQMARRKFPSGTTSSNRKFSNIDAIESAIRKYLKIEPSCIKGWKSLTELRRISNAIKHEGEVNKKLAGFAGWNMGDRFTHLNLGSAFERLTPDVLICVEDFVAHTGTLPSPRPD